MRVLYWGMKVLLLPQRVGGVFPLNATALVNLTGPTNAASRRNSHLRHYPLTNFEAMTRTYTLTNTLPAPLTYHAGSSRKLHYNPATRQI